MEKKILIISGIRSDYDLLQPLAAKLNEVPFFNVKFYLCAPHFSLTHNNSYQLVEADGFDILNSSKMREHSFYEDTASRVDALGTLIRDLNKYLEEFQPDLTIYLGDREEPLAAAIACAYNNMPSLHIAGGDNCFPKGGDVDEPVRHAISKLSSLHLVMAEQHKERLIKMGEPANRVEFVGNPGIDRILSTPQLSLAELNSIPSEIIDNNYAVVIYHVMSSVSPKDALFEYQNILETIIEKNFQLLIGAPNSDPGQNEIAAFAEKFTEKHARQSYFYKNLPRLDFVNLLRNSKFIIGNSSLGILEASFLRKPAINVGERQKGRLHSKNVLFSGITKLEIHKAIDQVNSSQFMEDFNDSDAFIYGRGEMVKKSMEFIKKNINRSDLLEKNITY